MQNWHFSQFRTKDNTIRRIHIHFNDLAREIPENRFSQNIKK